jgi:hypothetical protein
MPPLHLDSGTEPTPQKNLTACRHINSAALVKIVCQVGPLSSVDERAEHGLDHSFDGRIIDALGLRQLGRDGFEVAIACRWRQRHAAWHTIASWLSDKRKMRLAGKVHRGQISVQHKYAHGSRL